MTLADIIDEVDSREKTMTVINRETFDPMLSLLERIFDSEHVDVRDGGNEPGGPADLVQLQDEDGLALASNSISEIRDNLLLINSDMYITGTRELDAVETTEVVANLDDTTFTVAGKSKLLLIHISRHVEAMALENGAGVLHTGFQYLPRLFAERGTKEAYQRLAGSDVDVHVYGVPRKAENTDPGVDESDPLTQAVSRHEGETGGELETAWFVVHDGNGDDEHKAALVALATGPNEYEGFWTYRADIVDDVLAYIEDAYLER